MKMHKIIEITRINNTIVSKLNSMPRNSVSRKRDKHKKISINNVIIEISGIKVMANELFYGRKTVNIILS